MFTLEAGSAKTSGVPSTRTRSLVGSSVASASLMGFKWPGVGAGAAPERASETPRPDGDGDGEEDGGEGDSDETAWAGTDNAIPAQMQERAVLHRGRAQRRVGGGRSVIVERYNDSEEREERQCQSCEKEGEIACRGDVAVGVCKGGCVELQFLGRGKGNGCEDG